jgi:hypothetical protein
MLYIKEDNMEAYAIVTKEEHNAEKLRIISTLPTDVEVPKYISDWIIKHIDVIAKVNLVGCKTLQLDNPDELQAKFATMISDEMNNNHPNEEIELTTIIERAIRKVVGPELTQQFTPVLKELLEAQNDFLSKLMEE